MSYNTFEELLGVLEKAAAQRDPTGSGYANARHAVFEHVRRVEADRERLWSLMRRVQAASKTLAEISAESSRV